MEDMIREEKNQDEAVTLYHTLRTPNGTRKEQGRNDSLYVWRARVTSRTGPKDKKPFDPSVDVSFEGRALF